MQHARPGRSASFTTVLAVSDLWHLRGASLSVGRSVRASPEAAWALISSTDTWPDWGPPTPAFAYLAVCRLALERIAALLEAAESR